MTTLTDENHDLFQTLNASKQALEIAMLQILLRGELNQNMKERMSQHANTITQSISNMKAQ
jgi:hypothetical protein